MIPWRLNEVNAADRDRRIRDIDTSRVLIILCVTKMFADAVNATLRGLRVPHSRD